MPLPPYGNARGSSTHFAQLLFAYDRRTLVAVCRSRTCARASISAQRWDPQSHTVRWQPCSPRREFWLGFGLAERAPCPDVDYRAAARTQLCRTEAAKRGPVCNDWFSSTGAPWRRYLGHRRPTCRRCHADAEPVCGRVQADRTMAAPRPSRGCREEAGGGGEMRSHTVPPWAPERGGPPRTADRVPRRVAEDFASSSLSPRSSPRTLTHNHGAAANFASRSSALEPRPSPRRRASRRSPSSRTSRRWTTTRSCATRA